MTQASDVSDHPQAAQRLSKILEAATSLHNSATRYLFNQCGFMPGPDQPVSKHILRHPLLADYVRTGGGFHPTLIFQAVNEDTKHIAAEILFLTGKGELAPIEAPRRLLGALKGASVTVRRQEFSYAEIMIFERVEDALRASTHFTSPNIFAALRQSNILDLPILKQPSDSKQLVTIVPPADIETDRRQKYEDVCEAIHRRGFTVMLSGDHIWAHS